MPDVLVLQDINLNGIDINKTKYTLFLTKQTVKPCVGCWLKTPGKCHPLSKLSLAAV